MKCIVNFVYIHNKRDALLITKMTVMLEHSSLWKIQT